MALALNNLKRVDMPLNKETKPNQSNPTANPVIIDQPVTHLHWIEYVGVWLPEKNLHISRMGGRLVFYGISILNAKSYLYIYDL